jgi:hypothetical protein
VRELIAWLLFLGLFTAVIGGQAQATRHHFRGRHDLEWRGIAVAFAAMTFWLVALVFADAWLWVKLLAAVLWLLLLRDLDKTWRNRRRRWAPRLAGYKARAILARMRARAAG